MVTEAVLVRRSKEDIDLDLGQYPEVQVVGSQLEEDGYLLLLETADADALDDLLLDWASLDVVEFR